MTLESRIIEWLEDEASSDDRGLRRELLRTPDRDVILDRLSQHASPLVRAWTSSIARQVSDDRYLPLLRRLARDRDSEVRNVAMQDLLDGWPSEVTALLPAVRRELAGHNAVQALWIIADAEDQPSRRPVEALAKDARRPPYVRNLAGIVLLMLDRDFDAILNRITNHDHDSMHWLVGAAVKLDAARSVSAIADYVEDAPDSSCRHYCEAVLRQALPQVTLGDAHRLDG